MSPSRWPRRCAARPRTRACNPDPCQGVGVGSPGDVDEETGVVANARNLPNWLEPFELGKR